MRTGLVGCVKEKAQWPCAARDLYTSALFRGRRRFVEKTCDRWFILSAKHGLVDPYQTLDYYDETLAGTSRAARRSWSEQVLRELAEQVDPLQGQTLEVHAGMDYRDYGLIEGLRAAGASVLVPAVGLTLGLQLAFYSDPQKGRSVSQRDAEPVAARPEALVPQEGLPAFLTSVRSPITLRFTDVERILGRPLPPSARRHRAWWADSRSQTLARQWLAIGWRADEVDLAQQWVRLTK